MNRCRVAASKAGSAIGCIVGAAAGFMLVTVGREALLIDNPYNLAMIASIAMGAMSGAAGGAVGGLMPDNPKSVVYGGLAGIAAVSMIATQVPVDWRQDWLVILEVIFFSGFIGAIAGRVGGMPLRIMRALVDLSHSRRTQP